MVAVVLMLVVGPKDLPRILRTFTQGMRKAKSMAREFTSSLEDVARQDEFKEMKEMLVDAKEGNFDEMANIIGGDLKDVAEDVKSSAGLDDMRDDIKTIAEPAKPKATKPKSAKTAAKKAVAKKAGAQKAVAKKTAK